MIFSIFFFLITFLVVLVLAANAPEAQVQDVHVQDAYPAIAFFSGVVVAVLGWLLKFFLTRDRQSIDEKIAVLREEHLREVNVLHKHMEHMESKLKGWTDGLGIKVDRLGEVIDKKISEEVEELRRHDRDLFTRYDEMNRTLGSLMGEHNVIKGQHNRGLTQRDRNGGCP